VTSGADEYNAISSPTGISGFVYGDPSAPEYGIMKYDQALATPGLVDSGAFELNVVGRHHPGGEKIYGGTGNFLYVDTHVDRKTVLDTLNKREWGNAYYTLTGPNKVQSVN